MSRSARVQVILAALDTASPARGALPHELVRACAAALDAGGAGIVLMAGGASAGVLAASDRIAKDMEDLQFTLGEGPCVESVARARPVLVGDLRRAPAGRWPAFTPAALDLGVRSVSAFPLLVGRVVLGVLEVYSERARDLTDDELADALAYADASTAVLLHLQDQARSSAGDPAAIEVLVDRAEVHQATGVVAVQAEVGLGEAVLLLRSRAFADGVPVLSLARAVLAHEVRFAPAEQPPTP